ncbi:hypothetical protein BH20ACI4_BH20ACI4_13060 [soil metagenome]
MNFLNRSLLSQIKIIKLRAFKKGLLFLLTFFFVFNGAKDVEVSAQQKTGEPVFIRIKIVEPTGQKIRVLMSGFRHAGEPWYFQPIYAEATVGEWSEWIDLSNWDWHGRVDRAGGIAEWSSMKLSVIRTDSNEAVKGSVFAVQLADQPNEKGIVHNFTEKSASDSVGFLMPIPLRKNAGEFETGSQMTARHAKWAKEATGGKPVALKKFDIITSLWGHYDPSLALEEARSLHSMGFSIVGDISPSIARETGLRTYGFTGLYHPEPQVVADQWKIFAENNSSETGRQNFQTAAHFIISDEVSALDFRNVAPEKLDEWFRAYLKKEGVTAADLGQPIEKVVYPATTMFEPFLPQNAPLEKRRLLYYAAKFGQFWSAKQLRQISDLIQNSLPEMETETLLPSHGFLGNAWGAGNIGMSYRMNDIFELGAQQSVRRLAAEDWLGLNHMYGANYTWSGGQTFGYFNAILRSAMIEKPMKLSGLITPSDDEYLRLKAFSSLGQGAKSFFFWTFGPTYIGTENYWSDLRSEYDGIVKLNRSLAKAEDVLYPAKTVTDPVAILYSVSHDIWNTDNQAPFVEKRLLWHALRHLQIQPDFLREDDMTAEKLKNYKVLYITDWCISRKASAAIDRWIKQGGTVYLSAGAATRDEFYEAYLPPFAKAVWKDDAPQTLISEKHNYNERIDLPQIKPLTGVKVNLANQTFELPAIGSRIEMRQIEKPFAFFSDGKIAGSSIVYGQGKIIAVGFMPMLAYGQSANFKPVTLEENWKPEARSIIKFALDAAEISPVAASDAPVVETNLLTGANGSALVLANYTYRPIDSLIIDLKISEKFKQAISVEGNKVEILQSKDGVRLKLPLKLTDIILLKK